MPHEHRDVLFIREESNRLEEKGITLAEEIAQGSFGTVFIGTWRRSNNRGMAGNAGQTRQEKVAVKVIDLEEARHPDQAEKYLAREVDALRHLRHPNAIKLYKVIRFGQHIYLVFEMATRGTLSHFIRLNAREGLDEDLAGYWFNEIASAMYDLHHVHGFAHCDIKLSNILLNTRLNTKLADFGFARRAKRRPDGEENECMFFAGTRDYFSPEILRKVPFKATTADVWAMGVVLYTMVTYRVPFRAEKDNPEQQLRDQVNRRYRRALKWNRLSDECRDLIESMFAMEARNRIQMTQIVVHPWMTRYKERPAYLDVYCQMVPEGSEMQTETGSGEKQSRSQNPYVNALGKAKKEYEENGGATAEVINPVPAAKEPTPAANQPSPGQKQVKVVNGLEASPGAGHGVKTNKSSGRIKGTKSLKTRKSKGIGIFSGGLRRKLMKSLSGGSDSGGAARAGALALAQAQGIVSAPSPGDSTLKEKRIADKQGPEEYRERNERPEKPKHEKSIPGSNDKVHGD